MTQQNPLIQRPKLSHGALALDQMKPEYFLPALEVAFATARKHLSDIENAKSPATFENTILSLETSSEAVDVVSKVFGNLLSSESSDELQKLSAQMFPLLSEFHNDIILNEKIFLRVKEVFESRQKLNLNLEQSRLLEHTYDSFVRNGALLDSAKKDELRKLDEELSKLSPLFADHVMRATNEFSMHLTNEADLQGLPESAREAAAHEAQSRELKGWVFTLQAPSLIPFLKYSKRRDLREKMWRASASKAFRDKFDNSEILLTTVRLRHKRAQLLGFETHADFILQKRMAETPSKVMTFLKRLLDVAMPAAKRELKELQEYAVQLQGPAQLMPWDFAFYSEKLREEKYKFNEEELRPYFPLEQVIDGVFLHAKKLYNLKFTENKTYPVYHPDVKSYDVTEEDSGKFVGVFYADFFPRSSKKPGAWMTNFLEQGLFEGQVIRPHVSIVCNFTKPTPTKPSLLTFDEVRTLFHEFGHSLHSLLSTCTYRTLSGTNVYWDFVELPSQIMENWTLETESLSLFARHYQTGQPIPKDLVDKLKKSATFQAGYNCIRQVQFSQLDMAWHATDPETMKDVDSFERKSLENVRLLPVIDGSNFSCAFSHLFAGGYSAGYYSYKWAEVLDADAFELFKEKGLFDKSTAQKFKDYVLARGGTQHPMELYKQFRGREPDPDALLRRDGLL